MLFGTFHSDHFCQSYTHLKFALFILWRCV